MFSFDELRRREPAFEPGCFAVASGSPFVMGLRLPEPARMAVVTHQISDADFTWPMRSQSEPPSHPGCVSVYPSRVTPPPQTSNTRPSSCQIVGPPQVDSLERANTPGVPRRAGVPMLGGTRCRCFEGLWRTAVGTKAKSTTESSKSALLKDDSLYITREFAVSADTIFSAG